MTDDLKKLISENPTIISTCAENEPNIAIASDVALFDKNTIIIAHNEMIRTVENIAANPNISLLVVDQKKGWGGVRVFGKAKYCQSGKYFDKAKEFWGTDANLPIGVVVVKIDKTLEIK